MVAFIEPDRVMQKPQYVPLLAAVCLFTSCTLYRNVPLGPTALPAPADRSSIVFATVADTASPRLYVVHRATLGPQGLHGTFFAMDSVHARSAMDLKRQRNRRGLGVSNVYTVDPAWTARPLEGDSATVPMALLTDLREIQVDRGASTAVNVFAGVGVTLVTLAIMIGALALLLQNAY